MLAVLSANIGSSFRNVPERSITGMCSWSSRLWTLLEVLKLFACFCLHSLVETGCGSFATFGTILAELDFVALISEPETFRSQILALLLADCMFICTLELAFDLLLPLHDTEFWFKYTGIFVFTLPLSTEDGDTTFVTTAVNNLFYQYFIPKY